MSAATKRTILIVDDSEDDILFLRDALSAAAPDADIVETTDPTKAAELASLHAPDLMMIDLRMPRCSGHDVVEALRADTANDTRAIVMISSSRDVSDICEAYARRANAFCVKPSSLAGYNRLAERLVGYWFGTAEVNVATAV